MRENECIVIQLPLNTSIHSSKMRTAPLLTVSQHALRRGQGCVSQHALGRGIRLTRGRCLPGGCLPGGCLPGGGGGGVCMAETPRE